MNQPQSERDRGQKKTDFDCLFESISVSLESILDQTNLVKSHKRMLIEEEHNDCD